MSDRDRGVPTFEEQVLDYMKTFDGRQREDHDKIVTLQTDMKTVKGQVRVLFEKSGRTEDKGGEETPVHVEREKGRWMTIDRLIYTVGLIVVALIALFK
jgi:hypothetical protein